MKATKPKTIRQELALLARRFPMHDIAREAERMRWRRVHLAKYKAAPTPKRKQ